MTYKRTLKKKSPKAATGTGLNSSSYNLNVVIKINKIKMIQSTLLCLIAYCLEVKEMLSESSKAPQSQGAQRGIWHLCSKPSV